MDKLKKIKPTFRVIDIKSLRELRGEKESGELIYGSYSGIVKKANDLTEYYIIKDKDGNMNECIRLHLCTGKTDVSNRLIYEFDYIENLIKPEKSGWVFWNSEDCCFQLYEKTKFLTKSYPISYHSNNLKITNR